MGLLDRYRPPVDSTWIPPLFGGCHCASHVEELLEERIPLADGTGEVQVAQLCTAGALAVVPTPHELYVESPATQERRGPFHWRVLHEDGLSHLVRDDAPVHLDDVLFLQPEVESVLWLQDRTVLAVGAPRLCERGVQASVVRALQNPRLRTPA